MISKRNLVALILLLAGLQQLGSAGLIQAKAQLAPILIGSAWQETLASGGTVAKPWPWADTWPVARLQVPRHQVDLYVLFGARGNALAFGPGYDGASARPGEPGVTVIGGHRDTHFTFLQSLEKHTLLSLQLPSGEYKAYRVSGARVVDTRLEPLLQVDEQTNELLLITCFPFDAINPGGPLRYVVSARPLPNPKFLATNATLAWSL